MDKNNDKKKKFKELAEKRTNKIMDDLRLLGNLSNTSNYEYDQAMIDKIFKALTEELEKTNELFKDKKKGNKFSL